MKLKEITALNFWGLNTKDITLENMRPKSLEHVRQFNIVIGANNSGKSYLMRRFFTTPISDCDCKCLTLTRFEDALNQNKFEIRVEDIKHAKNWLGEQSQELFSSNAIVKLGNDPKIREIFGKELVNQAREVFDNTHDSVNHFTLCNRKEYIPILRGLRTLDPDRDVYLSRTMLDYFEADKVDKRTIFTGQTLYNEFVYSLLGTEEEQASVKAYQNYLSTHFFEGQRVNIIPRKDRENNDDTKEGNDDTKEGNDDTKEGNDDTKENNVVHIKIGNEPQRPIYDLGDGIQSMITLTVRPFLEKEPTIFFIEEPEQNLHAGMQRALIEAFRACPQHMFFFTTQSNHFVDLTLESDDINLISVKKEVDSEGKATSIVQSQANNNEILKELGVLASSVLLANCSIWVEGVTDKRYLQVYLEKYLDELEVFSNSDDRTKEERAAAKKRARKLRTYSENLHYVFVEYQGSNITHWAFTDEVDPEKTSKTPAQKLSKDIFLLADADIDNKGNRVQNLREALDNRFELLNWKEIENYIPQDIIVKAAKKHWTTFKNTDGSSCEFDNLPDGYFEDSEIGIGGLLEDKVSRSETATKAKDSYFYRDGAPTKKVGNEVQHSPSSGSTIRIKVAFCDTVVNIMKGKDKENQINWQLTPELNGLCDKIWSFIEECN
ncbi:TPA: AAA family ATPase [Vibrio vulnificus]|nr:AAA family ATPase [Vibrio vulnificus]